MPASYDPQQAPLVLRTFGGLAISLQGAPLARLPSRKAEALLVFLARVPHAHLRDTLAAMLWETSLERARGNLAVVLSAFRQQLAPYIQITRRAVSFDDSQPFWLDALIFEQSTQQALTRFSRDGALPPAVLTSLEQALALYHGDFLQGFSLADSPEFEQWLIAEQARLRQLAIDGYHTLVVSATQSREFARGINAARRLLLLDPLREEANRQLMQLLATSGQRNAALEQYERWCALLQDELGIAPEPETSALAQQIREGLFAMSQAAPELAGYPSSVDNVRVMYIPNHSLVMPLVGRSDELEQIRAHLLDPNCRLLSLTGPGGVGKTRLAFETALRFGQQFRDGATLVDLAPLVSPAQLAVTIAEALGLNLGGARDPHTAVVRALSRRHGLLILDNIEHLLDDLSFLQDVIAQAPQMTLLITSRERLEIAAERVFPVPSLPYPLYDPAYLEGTDQRFWRALPPVDELLSYSAVALFFQRTAPLQPGLMHDRETLAAVVRICNLVEGIPLAIELAAAWAHTINCTAIAEAISANMDALAVTRRDLPARHRSLRAAFDHSWQLLAAPERQGLRQLASFRGSFDRAAAQAVLGKDRLSAHHVVTLLERLIDRSLLQQTANGRFWLHEMVRQYAAEHLRDDEHDYHETRRRHCRYYAGWLASQARLLYGPDQGVTLGRMNLEHDNVLAAWMWASTNRDSQAVLQMHDGLRMWCDLRSQFQEGQRLFAYTASQLESAPNSPAISAVLGVVLAQYASFCERVGEYARGVAAIEQALALLRQADDSSMLILALSTAGRIAEHQGHYAEACRLQMEAVALGRTSSGGWRLGRALHNLANALESAGDFPAAYAAAAEAITLLRALGEPRMLALALNTQGIILEQLRDPAAAAACYDEALTIFTSIDDQWGSAIVQGNLGDIAAAKDALSRAWEYYLLALRAVRVSWNVPPLLIILVKLADVAYRRGDHEQALTLLILPLAHSELEQSFREHAQQLAAMLKSVLVPVVYQAICTAAEQRSLEATIAELLAEHVAAEIA